MDNLCMICEKMWITSRQLLSHEARNTFWPLFPMRGGIAMPVDKSRYPTSWPKVSRVIRRIAGNCCEWCHAEDGASLPSGRKGKVVLTVAHLGTSYADGKPGDKRDKHDIRRENLAALCQACHLRYDLNEHIQHARETRQRKKRERIAASGQLPLFD